MTKRVISRWGRSLLLTVALISSDQLLRGNTCSGFAIDQITHNSFRVAWQNDEFTSQSQVQYGLTGSYGSIEGDSNPFGLAAGGTRYQTLTGLVSNATYHFAAQSNNGVSYCPAIDRTVTTSAIVPHPVLPIPPATFAVSAPAPATGAIHMVSPATCANIPNWAALYGGTSCVNETSLKSAIASGASANATFGDTIVLQANSVNLVNGDAQSTVLTLADAPDSTIITSFVASTGVWTTGTPHGLSVGNQIILGSGPLTFGVNNDNLPLPFNPGYSYFVKSAPSSTTFTLAASSGGALVTGLAGTDFAGIPYACFLPSNGIDITSRPEITIRTSTSDSLLPPFGVTLYTDASLNILNPSIFATIRTASLTSGGARLDEGCLAHHYRFVGIKWDYAPVGVTNEYDGQSYSQFVNISPANHHITFDRNWMHGGDYPERDFKWCVYCDGHYIALINSVLDGMNFWTPSWSWSLMQLMSGSVITIPPGKIYFGNGVSDNLDLASGGTLTITAGGGVSGTAIFEATRSGFFLTMPTGVTATCVIPGRTCTVSTAASPTFAQSGGLYTRVAIALPSIVGGAWTAVNENAPPFVSLPSQSGAQEGTVLFAVNRGPGPYLVEGNIFHNTPGISFYFTGDYVGFVSFVSGPCVAAGLPVCQWLTNPGDLVFRRNTIQIDDTHLANENNPAWNGRFYSMRQHYEYKAAQRTRIVGNVFSGAFCANFSGRGENISFSNLGGVPTTSADHEIAFNTFKRSCQNLQIEGGHPGTAPIPQIASQRLWFHDNSYTGVDRYSRATFNTSSAPGDNGQHLSISKAPGDMIFEHEFFDINKGSSPSNNLSCYLMEGFTFRNNIIGYSNDDNLNDWWFQGCGGIPNPTGLTAAALMPVANPVNFFWNNNVFFGGYLNSRSGPEMNSTDIATQLALWNSLPSTTFAAGDTIAARAANLAFTNYTGGSFQLRSTSPYVSGGTGHAADGLDLGPDTLKQCVQQGCVLNARARSVGAASAIVSFVAPDAVGCPVDISANGLTTFNRIANSGGSRVQDVPLGGLTAATTYTYRVNCAVRQPIGTFTTTP
jgi:hypothetical protein